MTTYWVLTSLQLVLLLLLGLQLILSLKAAERLCAAEKDADRYRWLCDRLGVTRLPVAIEEITGCGYVPDGKAAIDSAIDAALSVSGQKGEPS